jgi:DMSO/TMAO reductase YedYZ molybdopterin-dependent catalytic subunit
MEHKGTRFGIAGLIAAGIALGTGELLAGLFDAVPSPLASVGGWVVDSAPPFVKDTAIAVLGTADKPALAIGTTVIALIVGWFAGIRAASRRWIGPVVFGGFGLVGVIAGRGEPLAELVPLIAALAVAASAGWVALELLTQTARTVEQPTDGLSGDTARRRFIRLAAGGSAVAVVAGVAGRQMLTRVREVPEFEDVPLDATGLDVLGENMFDVPGLSPIVVPNEDFYRIDTALVVPSIDETDWSLRVHGLVDSEVVLSYDDLLGMEIIEDYVTIACVSNEVGGNLVGNALWGGVRLSEVLDMAGVKSEASQLVGRSIDGFTVGFPPEIVYDGREPLIAVAMNGEPLPRAHGFPARLIVPGLYGFVSATKWLTELELTTWDGFDAYWIPRGWAKEAPIKTQSRIDVPDPRDTLVVGDHIVAGVAWAPLKGIDRVEVQVDDGPWQEAEVSVPLSDRSWVQWSIVVALDVGRPVVRVRATDGTGQTQTPEIVSPRPDGATGHHEVRLRVA